MPDQVPPAVRAFIDNVAEKIAGHFAILEALEYIRCRNAGGSMIECLGHYKIKTPGVGDPFFEELLSNLDAAERRRLLTAVKEGWQEGIESIDKRLEELDPQAKTGIPAKGEVT